MLADEAADEAPVVVTAARIAQTVDETLAPVSVVSRRDIERLLAGSVRDVLRGLAGVAVANNGGRGQPTSMFLRGSESDHVLVLIDGVRVGAATSGTFGFEHVPIDQVERIEVVRGPRASLYGSDAIGGVIHIFTRQGGGALAAHGRLSTGSRGATETAIGISGGGDRAWFNLIGNRAREDGFDACKEGSVYFGCFTASEPDDDGYRNIGLSVRAGYRFHGGAEVEGRVLRNRSDVEFDGSFENETEVRQTVYGGKLSISPSAGWRATLNLSRSEDDSSNYRNGAFTSRFATRRDEAVLQNDIEIGGAHLLTAGLDYRRDQVSGTTDYLVRERGNKGGFVQFLGALGAHQVQLAGRYDDNEQFGGAGTGGIAWGWQILDGVRLTASYGAAFKAPSFNDLYWPRFGNPRLDPEESETLDLGLSGRRGSARWSFHAFSSDIDGLIAYDVNQGMPVNISHARIRGFEAALGTRLFGFDVGASLTLLDSRNQDPGTNEGNRLARRPSTTAHMDVDRTLGRFRFGATVHAAGPRYDDPANTRRLGGFFTMDLRAAYQIGSAWFAEGRVENLFDERYETASGYNQPGRGIFVTLRYRP